MSRSSPRFLSYQLGSLPDDEGVPLFKHGSKFLNLGGQTHHLTEEYIEPECILSASPEGA
jgi:hypothetical protein